MATVKVWDLPTRLFHWSLVTVFAFQYITVELLDDAMQLHFYGGYVALGIILFRIIWGFVGTYHARFSHFIYSPNEAFSYLKESAKGNAQTYLGHNPLGGYSVLAILAVMLTQATSGLFMTDDIFLDGPYYGVFSDSIDDIMNFLHHNAITLMYALIALHLAAIIWYSVKKKQKLVPAMLHGNKPSDTNSAQASKGGLQSASVATPWIRFMFVVLIVAAAVYLLVEILPPQPEPGLYDY
jgi:cytochrome b